ncbi:MAG: sulfite exporter TauE/SafE family protein [Verrucomicrobiae bacterium]|nr:sulfite exporter TauE/SafE family protein [Verrucomicrobiae bacterium]
MQLEIWQLIFLASMGILAGVLNVIAGGGSLLTLPVMIFLGIPESVANGTNRVAIFAQNVTAVSGFRKKGFSDFRLSFTLALAAVPGSVLGAQAGVLVRGETFNRILAVVMIAVIVLMAVQQRSKEEAKHAAPVKTAGSVSLNRSRWIWGHIAMVGVGFYGGFIQAGVGFLIMAVLSKLMKLDLVRVNMHKVFVVGMFTLAALIVFIIHGKIWWVTGLCLAVGNSLGGWIGSQLSVTKGEGFIRRVLYIALLVMAIKLLFG